MLRGAARRKASSCLVLPLKTAAVLAACTGPAEVSSPRRSRQLEQQGGNRAGAEPLHPGELTQEPLNPPGTHSAVLDPLPSRTIISCIYNALLSFALKTKSSHTCRGELGVQILCQKLFSHTHIQRDRHWQPCRCAVAGAPGSMGFALGQRRAPAQPTRCTAHQKLQR